MVNSPTPPPQSPKRSFAEISSNPRRTSPARSKSLPRHKKVKIDHSSDESFQAPAQPQAEASSIVPATGERESSSDQSAARWFKRVNENVNGPAKKPEKREGGRNPPPSAPWFANAGLDESPFYISHQNRYQPSQNLRSVNAESFGQLGRADTEKDELREVIDDLTVQNKKLKALLRSRHNRASPATSDPDKMIEVRTHGLPPEKKRELERLLKNFTTSVDNESASSQQSSSTPVVESAPSSGQGATPGAKGPPAEPTNTDSGYASMSNSALNSTSYSAPHNDTESKSRKDSAIKNYLSEVPDFLLPQSTLSVSESTKMQLVVQRLEQLFTGNLAVPGEHSLPIQQQKISRSAAKADRREDEKMNRTSKPEGSREAHILPPDSKINFDAMDHGNGQRVAGQSGYAGSSSGTPRSNVDAPGSPDQRPTRPLDLDIHRAQVAADNIQYIRHLGFSSPRPQINPGNKEQPWMYLNLLVSLAQLHTLNVTPAFVRKAVKTMSTNFELSKDGHKIRWKGNVSDSSQDPPPVLVTLRSVDSVSDDRSGQQNARSVTGTVNGSASMSVSDDKVPREMASTTSKQQDSTTSLSNMAVGKPSTLSKSSSFDYRPVVYHKKKITVKGDHSYLDSSSSSGELSPDSAGLAPVLNKSSLRQNGESAEGFLTFFSNPYFLVDLSGDNTPTSARSEVHPYTEGIIGVPEKPVFDDDNLRDASACYFVRVGEGVLPEKSEECPDVCWPLSPIAAAGEDETQPIELPASGLGGVVPEDNFAVDVKVERTKMDRVDSTKAGGKRQPSRYSYRIIQCTKLELQPPRLPPPSYVFFTSSSSSGEHDYLDGDSSSDSAEDDDAPAPAGFLWQWSSSSAEQQPGEEYSEDSSLGVLQAARARAPDAGIRRAQDPDMITTQTGVTMSGSLAATVGATYSATSAADLELAREDEDEDSSSGMDCD